MAGRGTPHTGWVELVIALLVAGIGISMALPTVPAAVLNAVAATHLGTASGISYMAQRFGSVFAVAIGSAGFSAYGSLGDPAAGTAGERTPSWPYPAPSCAAAAAQAEDGSR